MTRRLPPFPGGQEIHVVELTRRQLQAGHAVDLWYAEGAEVPDGATGHKVSARLFGVRTSGLTAASLCAWRASRGMRSVRGDIIHVHGDFPDAWFGHRAARATATPVVMTVHGGLNRRHTKLTRIAVRHIDHFLAHGNHVAADLEACGVPSEQITVMSSGINRALLEPYMHRPLPEHPRVVTIGALDPMKNHETLIAAAAIARRHHPDLELVVIGEGRERAHLERLARNTGNVRFTGQLPRSAAYDIVSQSSVFSLASRRLPGKGEGVPTAMLEAMALARPCVVSAACDPSAIADRDSDAYVVADTSAPESLATAICSVLDDRDRAVRMGERAAQAVADLDWDDVAARIEAVYRTVLARHSRPR